LTIEEQTHLHPSLEKLIVPALSNIWNFQVAIFESAV